MINNSQSPSNRLRNYFVRKLKASISLFFGSRVKYQRYYSRENWHEGAISYSELINVRVQYLIDRLMGRVPPKCADSYLTHLPVLVAMSRSRPILRVLELGSGLYSTLTFLDREYFPDLNHIDSLENYKEWADKIVMESGQDDRLKMHAVDQPLADVLDQFNLDAYDLIFVDDALTREERARTISKIASAKPTRPVIIIHDYDMPVYRRAAGSFRSTYRFTALYPNTGVASNSSVLGTDLLARVDHVVRKARQSGLIPDNPLEAADFLKRKAKSVVL
jgi:hypothetical protein